MKWVLKPNGLSLSLPPPETPISVRKIIAWTLSDTMEVSTIDKAKTYRNTESPLIIHSDRGSQYVSNAWFDYL